MASKSEFKPGKSGNPKGRPKGIQDRRVAMRELLRPHAADLVQKAIDLALSGDTTALRLCVDRIIPPCREEAISVTLPKIAGPDDCTKAQAVVLAAVADGGMLPSAAQVLSGLIDAQRRAYETSALSERMAAIEKLVEERKVTK